MASLKDIASELNVSKTLVSAVLNNKQGTIRVSPQLAEIIKKKAEELGYQKNRTAASLYAGRHDIIGVFIHRVGEVGSGILERMVHGLEERLHDRHQRMALSFFNTPEEFIKLSSVAHRGSMDGLIVGGWLHPELADAVCKISDNGLPVVTIQNQPMHPSIINVGMSEESIGYVATRHLIEKGCRRIGCIRTRALKLRYDGYCRAMREEGLNIDPAWDFDSKELYFSLASGEACARKILNESIALDGLVTGSDQQAAGAINVFQSASVRIPEDIKIIGVDNSAFCDFLPVPISSVSQKITTMSRLAMDLLIKIQNGETVESIILEPELKIRRSSGGE
jgi:LacI family transcriptional regulator